ncbi:sugar O-acetyltransferase [Vallitaleaceae bacterium 9-2]
MDINKKEWERMISEQLYNPYRVGGDSFDRVHLAQKKFNESEFWHDKTAFEELKKCFHSAPDDMILTPPVYFDHGDRVKFGKHFYANTDLTILDENYVIFGDNVFLAPHVSIYTAGHPIDAEVRNMELEYAKPVTIGSDVWIGGNVIINPGVTIGDNVVIGSGSVVIKDIPCNVIAAGNPCRIIREITKKDKKKWKNQLKDYEEKMKNFY